MRANENRLTHRNQIRLGETRQDCDMSVFLPIHRDQFCQDKTRQDTRIHEITKDKITQAETMLGKSRQDTTW